jgi:hypothetical protein
VDKHSDNTTVTHPALEENHANKLVGKSNLKRRVLINMMRALSFHPWRNTPMENARLCVAKQLLEKKHEPTD